MRIILILATVICFVGCGGQRKAEFEDTYRTFEWLEDLCGPSSASLAAAGFSSEDELFQYARENGIVSVNGLPTPYLARAVSVLRSHFPDVANRFLRDRGIELRLLYGTNVLQDPKVAARALPGRSYEDVVGIAYAEFATVFFNEDRINTATLLHERAHQLDRWDELTNLRTTSLTLSSQWMEAMVEPERQAVVRRYCGSHCDTPSEGFAETFALFYACPKSRALFNNSPKTIAFMEYFMSEIGKRVSPVQESSTEDSEKTSGDDQTSWWDLFFTERVSE